MPHPRARWTAEPWYIDSPAERALIDRLERTWPALGEVVAERPARGVVTGCNRAFVVDRATRDRLLADDPSSAALLRPLLKGRDVRRFTAAAPERWILLVERGTSLGARPAIAAHLARFRSALEPRPPDHVGPWSGRKPGTYRWFELQDPVGALAASRAPRLFYQDIQTGPACALDRSGELVPDTTVWVLPSADPVLLAILNSSLYGWYAQRRFPPALHGSVRPKLEYLRALPIAAPGPSLRARIHELVERALVAATPALDAALDQAIAEAYALSPRERALIG
jgi:TaqI-like C-terminal specificity domain